ncbi:MAG: glyceraldehyde-3-phosphate dehydrogenase [Deltaproteobacteria bacterium]|nr:glyceraldehyde-3-phosphate dehydrogenase [Deltaproteobacteria bacterium]MBW1966646.1 glyceraldehyde-3-phosphate dehydrogenase [Deltaproteobacteria bacterium]MBW2097929.1 glyceraldehyde-3-phosphate dehydrogenase [Deltaproteobacteria bacterium]PXF56006.1 MAG: glyceraldehyde-3-phosphate dehydrogenase [Deltaproteobacteria bacterium]RKX61005.1 MAG: glyceraldehyde-3-phosphate dehydrogenase [Thermodesulfobacteriota bacterium]
MENISKSEGNDGLKLGINGLGRIGKLTLWHHVARKYFNEIVVNIGRDVGTSLMDIAHYLERDSTYGSLGGYLYGYKGEKVIQDVDEEAGYITIDGTKVKILRRSRNPKDIGWREHGARIVVDTTGQFTDPTVSPDEPRGSVRGHLESGAKKVIVSAPFKIKDKARAMPDDAVTTVMGINENDYDPRAHRIISNASCTTTCLAHMMKPLLDSFGSQRILTASMATVHAVTGSQEVLDRLPKSGAIDLRKNRSILNNIILTTTGAANTLALVIPEMKQIGFIAQSVRIPTTTGSLIILVVNLQEEPSGESIRKELINNIYKDAAARDSRGYLHYTEEQNVSCDIIGLPRAGAIIEGNETHTRTAEVNIDLQKVCRTAGQETVQKIGQNVLRIAITQAVIYGWYDNELGSYVNMLGDRTVSVAKVM